MHVHGSDGTPGGLPEPRRLDGSERASHPKPGADTANTVARPSREPGDGAPTVKTPAPPEARGCGDRGRAERRGEWWVGTRRRTWGLSIVRPRGECYNGMGIAPMSEYTDLFDGLLPSRRESVESRTLPAFCQPTTSRRLRNWRTSRRCGQTGRP